MRRKIFVIDVTYEGSSSWSEMSVKDILKLLVEKGADVKNVSIKNVNKRGSKNE